MRFELSSTCKVFNTLIVTDSNEKNEIAQFQSPGSVWPLEYLHSVFVLYRKWGLLLTQTAVYSGSCSSSCLMLGSSGSSLIGAVSDV